MDGMTINHIVSIDHGSSGYLVWNMDEHGLFMDDKHDDL